MKFPEHKASMYLTHNEHRNDYMPLSEFLEIHAGLYDWESPEARKRCLDTDELWTLQWYPHTPVGFTCVAAPTFDECVAFANRISDQP